jgi:hypothetical protein
MTLACPAVSPTLCPGRNLSVLCPGHDGREALEVLRMTISFLKYFAVSP